MAKHFTVPTSETTTRARATPVAAASATPLHDAAAFNADFNWSKATGLPSVESDFYGTTLRGKPVLPLGANVPGTVNWQIDAGVAITPHKGVIKFSFFDAAHLGGVFNNPHNGFTEQVGASPFSEAQRVAARTAIQNWDELIAPSFKEVNGTGGADIVFANTTTGPDQAWAYYPTDYGQANLKHLASDLFTATPSVNASNGQLLPGQYGLQTLNHELGHTLGLSHPGNYNYDPGGPPINYTNSAEYFQDSNQFTIMSYFDSYETGAQNVDWNVMRFLYPSTPMVHDVAVIQAKYGADMTTRTGNTTYGFNPTADVTNEGMKFHTGEMATIFTIWDAGGNDTLDLSGYYTDSVIDLRPGAYSSAGGWGAYDPSQIGTTPTLAGINANNAAAGLGPRTERLYHIYFDGNWTDVNADGTTTLVNEGLSWKQITGTDEHYLMQDNIGIAYGATIENAIGGFGNDRINGNTADNRFTGGDGNDTFVLARYGTNDRSVDTITDFQGGHDHIDLTSFSGLTAENVAFNAAAHLLSIDTNHDGIVDMTVNVFGTSVGAGDYIFG